MKGSSKMANILADRILAGADKLAEFAKELTQEQWDTPVLGDGRSIGVVVHHVAYLYPVEVELSTVLASGNPITEVTKKGVDEMNATHAQDFANVTKEEALELLNKNSRMAADAIRGFTDEQLQNGSTISLNANAPLTAQFFIEDHPVRHSFHHLERIRASLPGV